MDKDFHISRFEKGLSILVIFATLLVLYFLCLDLFVDTTNIQDVIFYFNLAITVIFLIDLVFLYKKSKNIKEFISKNWLDIISVIPFGMAFGLAKLVRAGKLFKLFTKASKVTKLSKTTKFSKLSKGLRLKSEVPKTGKILSKFSKDKEGTRK